MSDVVDRRGQLADAAITLIARDGLRALTHRAVDDELGLPAGSTSYYARTRQALIDLVVQELASRTTLALSSLPRFRPTPEGVATAVAAVSDALLADPRNQRARVALLLDPAVAGAGGNLGGSSLVRPVIQSDVEQALAAMGVDQPAERAVEALTLIDGLLIQRAVRGNAINTYGVVLAYLRGCQPSGR